MLHISIQEKKYHNQLILENVEISLQNEGLYGVVGKNGSGKTTLFHCLTHLTSFKGEILYKNEKITPQDIAFVPTEPYLYEYLSVKEFYNFYASLMRVSITQPMLFDIDNSLLIRELSTGMRKKVYLNAIFQKKYKIYVFDELFNGLDLESVYYLKKKIQLLAQKHIVLISSHILETLHECKTIFLLKDKNSITLHPSMYPNIEQLLFES